MTILAQRLKMLKDILILIFSASLNKLLPIDMGESLWIVGTNLGYIHIAGHQYALFPASDVHILLLEMLERLCMFHV
jgi:hypothetical protein